MALLNTISGKDEALQNAELQRQFKIAMVVKAQDLLSSEVVGTAIDNFRSIYLAREFANKQGTQLFNNYFQYIVTNTNVAVEVAAITEAQIQSAVNSNFVAFAETLSI